MDIRLIRARKIWSDGKHNAFTGIAEFAGRTFVTFRTGTTHASGDGAITVIASSDREIWDAVNITADPAMDLRDPKATVFDGKLMILFAGRDSNITPENRSHRISMVMASEDGETFAAPRAVTGLPDGHWLWHIVPHDGVLYGTVYHHNADNSFDVALYRSSDGFAWEHVADFPVGGGETYIDFDAQGTLWALIRCDSAGYGPTPVLCSAKPPYTQFGGVRRLVTKLNGPMLKRLDNGCVIICRRWDAPRRNLRSDVLWLGDRCDLQDVTRLPSGGDTSYAGWIDVAPGRAVVSYYSSHEHKMDEPIENDAVFKKDAGHAEHNTPADIFLADFSYPET